MWVQIRIAAAAAPRAVQAADGWLFLQDIADASSN
jgi:hypothetical protein